MILTDRKSNSILPFIALSFIRCHVLSSHDSLVITLPYHLSSSPIKCVVMHSKTTNSNNSSSRENPSSDMSSATTGVNSPLLQENRSTAKHTSVSGAVFNVSTSIIGAGIMSIPATLKVLGVVPAFFMIVVIAWLADVSVEFLMRYTHAGKSTTYAGVMKESFGRVGSVLVQICVLMNNLGCLIIYLIIIGDVLSGNQPEGSVHLGVLQEWFGIHWWNTRAFALLFIVVVIMLPLVLFRRVESLRFSSAIAVFLAVLFVAISSVMAISALFQGKTESPRLLPHLDNKTSFFDLFTAVPVIVTAFTFHFNVHPIGFEMDKPSDMMSAVRISLILCGAIYFTVGIFGYLLFGDSIMPDILVNFDQNSGPALGSALNDIVRLSYALHLILVFPLLNFSLRANIDEFLFPNRPILAKDNTRYMSLTLILLAICYLAAITIPNIWYFFQFMGSTSAVSLAFIFPGAIALRDVHGISTSRDRIMSAVMIILAAATSIIAISTNIYSFFT
ncbi:PREDICTED: putative sodium-coupled neutral amino acid transporter 7 [Theobroma cacao]|uniref:Sodium-coupled neutral amino acid transporter 7 n=1 Tax=Theobroma cacao TaxID=3641 RepID=A0AB32UL46_THECC|nr:PREDICTED: putative sodium-coupled neutral amino acid transporter 7 [Theobroma cacao]XP_007008822.2 PREDICTED: putative sodium-coupled neutral amino acid transporter 7 [Theobroma cacao]XP_017984753.1 PREDICTED: putative sodium-coupled neutral amino acid transporter 7 [Theobroma cacao]